jgi:hypothetical protein
MMRLVVVGATGMVGGYAIRYALEQPNVEQVTSVGRRTLGISHPKLTEILHRDFADCSALTETLRGQDGAIFCLGTYTGAVPDAEFRRITVDYTVEFAEFSDSAARSGILISKREGADPGAESTRLLATKGRKGGPGGRVSALTSSGPRTSTPSSRGRAKFSYRLLRWVCPPSGGAPRPYDSVERLGP